MKSSVKKVDKSSAEIEIEIPAEDFQEHIKKALGSFQEHLKTQGFRKGKAPLEIVRQKVGQRAVLNRAAELAISNAYAKAIKEHGIEAIGQPEVQLTKLAEGNPLQFRVKTTIVPDIVLPEYKTIAVKVERKEIVVEEKEVEKAFEWLSKNRKGQDDKTQELTDEFAKSLGNFENAVALKKSIKQGLMKEKEMGETQRIRQEVLDGIAKETDIAVPASLLEGEKRSMMENLKQGVVRTLKLNFTEYLKKIQKSEQELLDSFGEEAEKRVKNYLVLREIAKRENIAPTAQEVREEMQKILRQYSNLGEAQKSIDLERLKEYTELALKNEKTLQFLQSYTQ